MTDIYSMVLAGLVQGVTEWLPVSSSGQGMLALINLIGLSASDAFSLAIFLHLGTLLAVMVKMRSDLWSLALSLPGWRNDRLVQFILVSTFVTGIVGIPVYMLLKENFEAWQGDIATAFIGFFLMFTGVVLFFSKRSFGSRAVDDMGLLDMVFAGFAQGLSILPGVSRSGLTVAALLFRGFGQERALKLSFVMSVPAILGALALDFIDEGLGLFEPAYAVGLLSAFIAGYLSIDALLRVAKNLRFDLFCMFFGFLAVLAYLSTLVL